MDAALKARNMGSAAARRQRIQDRRIQQELALQERIDHKKRVMSELQQLEQFGDESDCETLSSPDFDSATETPLELSVRTPENASPSDVFVSLSPSVYDMAMETMVFKPETKQPDVSLSRPQARPRMQATLTTVADWNYDRFSLCMSNVDDEEEPVDVIQSGDESFSISDEELDDDSPIETATPILYTLPRIKPAVVSITTIQIAKKPQETELLVEKRPRVRRHVSEQLSLDGSEDNRVPSGSKMLHSLNSSRETLGSTNNSSQCSRSMSTVSQHDSTISRSVSQTSYSDQSQRSPKRKSSLPLLFGMNKSGHSRMSSIKKFIRSSTLGPPVSDRMARNPLQRTASNAALETHFEGRNGSLDIVREHVFEEPKRPMTARAPSPTTTAVTDITALPSVTHVMPTTLASRSTLKNGEDQPMRPGLKFRQRSGSIGQALKSISSGVKKTDVSAPPVPAIIIPPPSIQTQDVDSTSTPPPLTPRNPRRSLATYSAFPGLDKRTSTMNLSSIGLGLRY